MKNFELEIKNKVLATNEKGELKQNVRNEFKHDLTFAFKDFLKQNGFDVRMVSDGVAIQFENDELGSVCVVFDGTVKPRQYDIETEHQVWLDACAEKVIKAEKLKAEKEAKIAQQNANKLANDKKKATK